MDPATKTQLTPPNIPSGEEVYQIIMTQIEPELLPENVKTLTEKYKDETPEQTKARAARYEVAFQRYRETYDRYTVKMTADVTTYLRTDLQNMEQGAKQQENVVLGQLEQSMLTA